MGISQERALWLLGGVAFPVRRRGKEKGTTCKRGERKADESKQVPLDRRQLRQFSAVGSDLAKIAPHVSLQS